MKKIASTLIHGFSPLKNANFRLYAGGQAVSLVGTFLQSTAQGWLVWQLTGSEAALGVVTMLNSLPFLVLGPWAGVWADRWDRRKLLIGTQVCAMLLAFALAFLVQTGLVQLWHVFLLGTLLGVVNTLDMPAQQAFVGDLSGMGEVRKAVNLNSMMIHLSRSLGPAFAGFLIAKVGNAPAFWLNGLSFLAVVASLVAVRSSQTRRATSKVNPLSQVGEAFRFLRSQPRIQDMFFFMALLTLFFWSVLLNLLPAVADKVLHGNAETLGTLQAASGMGAFTGVLLIVPLAQTIKRSGLILSGAALWVGTWLILFSTSQTVPFAFLSLFLTSIAAPSIFTTVVGLIQVMTPDHMRARLLSLFTMLTSGVQPLAAIAVGILAEQFGVQRVIQLNGFLMITGTVTILLVRTDLRHWSVPTTPVSTFVESIGMD